MSAEPQLFAKDLAVGQTFAGRTRTIDEEEFGSFARLTGDDHPIHYEEAFAAKTRFGRRVAHGLLLMSMTALGATDMSRRLRDAMVALTEQRCRFLKPVFAGDVVTSQFKIVAIQIRGAGRIIHKLSQLELRKILHRVKRRFDNRAPVCGVFHPRSHNGVHVEGDGPGICLRPGRNSAAE